MKTSVISEEFRERYLSNPHDPERLRGPGGRLRRAGGLSPPDRRSRARHRRALHAVHPRHRADRLSGRRRGGEHAAAGRAHQTRHPLAALHRRRPPVGHLGLAVDPQRLAGGGGGRRACAPARPATGCASTSTRASANILISDEELAAAPRRARPRTAASRIRKSQTPWQEIQRGMVGQHATGACLELATRYQDIASRFGIPAPFALRSECQGAPLTWAPTRGAPTLRAKGSMGQQSHTGASTCPAD